MEMCNSFDPTINYIWYFIIKISFPGCSKITQSLEVSVHSHFSQKFFHKIVKTDLMMIDYYYYKIFGYIWGSVLTYGCETCKIFHGQPNILIRVY